MKNLFKTKRVVPKWVNQLLSNYYLCSLQNQTFMPVNQPYPHFCHMRMCC